MKRHLALATLAALIAANGAASAGPGMDISDAASQFEAEPVDMEIIRHRDGSVMSRESFVQPDGSVVTRMTIREAMPVLAEREVIELTPAQRRLIWHSVAVPHAAAVPIEIEDEYVEVPAPLAREHIEAAPGPRSYRVGARISSPQALQPLPDEVMVAVPNVQDHLYAVVGERVLVVDPHTNTVVAEVVR